MKKRIIVLSILIVAFGCSSSSSNPDELLGLWKGLNTMDFGDGPFDAMVSMDIATEDFTITFTDPDNTNHVLHYLEGTYTATDNEITLSVYRQRQDTEASWEEFSPPEKQIVGYTMPDEDTLVFDPGEQGMDNTTLYRVKDNAQPEPPDQQALLPGLWEGLNTVDFDEGPFDAMASLLLETTDFTLTFSQPDNTDIVILYLEGTYTTAPSKISLSINQQREGNDAPWEIFTPPLVQVIDYSMPDSNTLILDLAQHGMDKMTLYRVIHSSINY